jgi:hypothetical protein
MVPSSSLGPSPFLFWATLPLQPPSTPDSLPDNEGADMRISLISAALVAALVGYGSTIALVLSAAQALGASPAQTASWVFAVCIAKAVGSAVLSTWARVPVVLAWSTPGAALIAASEGLSMAEGVAAFVATGLLILATGLIRPLGRLIAAIPSEIAAAMLAGVLLPFCLKVPHQAANLPDLVLPIIGIFVLVRLYNPSFRRAGGAGGRARADIWQRNAPATGAVRRPGAGADSPALYLGRTHRSGAAALSGDDGVAESAGIRRAARCGV